MFVSEKASAYGGFVLGVLVLVGVGAGASMFMNHRATSYGANSTVEKQIAMNQERLESQHAQLERMNDTVRLELTPRKGQDESVRALAKEVVGQEDQLKELSARPGQLNQEIGGIQADGRAYRDRYRLMVRQIAIGEQIPELVTRTGKRFQNATISDVSASGMTIRHEVGMNRLSPSELDPKWAERFQWDAEEISSPTPLPVATTPPPAGNKPPKTATPEPPKNLTKNPSGITPQALEDIRSKVMELHRAALAAAEKVSDARNQAGSSRSRSVPGSIQTWDERIAALQQDSDRASSRLEAARSKLAEVSPNDFVLVRSRRGPN